MQSKVELKSPTLIRSLVGDESKASALTSFGSHDTCTENLHKISGTKVDGTRSKYLTIWPNYKSRISDTSIAGNERLLTRRKLVNNSFESMLGSRF